jgi:hypothetical protein
MNCIVKIDKLYKAKILKGLSLQEKPFSNSMQFTNKIAYPTLIKILEINTVVE